MKKALRILGPGLVVMGAALAIAATVYVPIDTVTRQISYIKSIIIGYNLYSGELQLYSEQGSTDYTATLKPNPAMSASSTFYMPSAVPGAVSAMYMDETGVMSYLTGLPLVAEADTLGTVTGRGAAAASLCQFQNVAGIEVGKDETAGTPNVAGTAKLFSAGDNAFYFSLTAATLTGNVTLTTPTALPAGAAYLLNSGATGTMGWTDPATFAAASHTHTRTQTITVTFDGGGSEIADNAKWQYQVPVACTLTGWTILADQAGAIKIDIWSQAYADYPPEDAQSICNGHEPEIAASAAMATDADIADWSGEALSAGATLIFNVDSCTTITRAVLILKATVTE